MNVLLLYPRFPETFWSFKYALKFIGKRAALPPLGLLTVASMLPNEWTLKLVDMNVQPLEASDVAWADLVFVSAMISQNESALAVIDLCRKAGKTVIAGGPLFVSDPTRFPYVNHLVLNEAELTLPPFLDDLKSGNARRIYTSTQFADIKKSPMPRWDLVFLKYYASMSVQFSRGCPFDCEFCDITAKFGHRPRTKTATQVIAELDSLISLGWKGPVFFVDDNFIGNKHMLKTRLLPHLIEWQRSQRQGIPFYTEASINLADDSKLMHLMVEAGFDTVFVGIETPDAAALEECNKRQNQGRDLVSDVKRIQRAGLQVQGGFIVGFDSDTENIFQRQVDFIQNSGIVTAMVGLLNALPDTRLHARMKREGRLTADSTGNNFDGTINFLPRMPVALLLDGYKHILREIYSPEPYYERIRTFLREYKCPTISIWFGWRHLQALILANVRLGLVGRERFQYWRLLFWTMVHRPALLKTAVTLAIYGHHFRKCSQNMGIE